MTATEHPDLPALLALAVDVAAEAGALVRAHRSRGVELAGTKSTPTDIVTEADRASEALIRRGLLGARPEDGMLGEEGSAIVGTSGVTWVVDPIDGTVNYLYDLPDYAVSIAAAVEGAAVVGVVHQPATGETWTAVRGGGAFLDGDAIGVSATERLDQALVSTGFGYAVARRAAQVRSLVPVIVAVRDIRRAGSAAVDLCRVATGRLDAHYERGLNPWDRAAGGLIAREAGATVGGLHGAAESDDLTIAATPGIFTALHDLLAAAGADHD